VYVENFYTLSIIKFLCRIDEDANGELSEEEFYLALEKTVGKLPLAEKTRLYCLVDADMSKAISYEEYPMKIE
jgi:hypothetical protein